MKKPSILTIVLLLAIILTICSIPVEVMATSSNF